MPKHTIASNTSNVDIARELGAREPGPRTRQYGETPSRARKFRAGVET